MNEISKHTRNMSTNGSADFREFALTIERVFPNTKFLFARVEAGKWRRTLNANDVNLPYSGERYTLTRDAH